MMSEKRVNSERKSKPKVDSAKSSRIRGRRGQNAIARVVLEDDARATPKNSLKKNSRIKIQQKFFMVRDRVGTVGFPTTRQDDEEICFMVRHPLRVIEHPNWVQVGVSIKTAESLCDRLNKLLKLNGLKGRKRQPR